MQCVENRLYLGRNLRQTELRVNDVSKTTVKVGTFIQDLGSSKYQESNLCAEITNVIPSMFE